VAAAAERWVGARVRVWGRSPGRAASLCARFPTLASVAPTAQEAVRDATLVVNATPMGLSDDAYPVDPAALPTGAAVVDLAYRPGETAWVRAARTRGARACDGLPMLIAQGALAFERWFGVAADREAMWAAARARATALASH
jgi:shikimate dehydrogenase